MTLALHGNCATLMSSSKLSRPQEEAIVKGQGPYADRAVSFETELGHVKLAGAFDP